MDSVLAQNYRPIEVVVVDDGSTDDTAAVVRSYASVRYEFQPNQGQPTARNTGVANSSGELIAFLDSDDLWVPEKLTMQMAYLAAHTEVYCLIGRLKNFLQEGIDCPAWASDSIFDNSVVAYSPSSLLTYRWVFDRMGGFSPAYRHQDTLDWLNRLRESHIRIGVMPQVLVHRRIHGQNFSRDSAGAARERLALVKRVIDRERNSTVASGGMAGQDEASVRGHREP